MKAIVLIKDNVEPKVNNLVKHILINHFRKKFLYKTFKKNYGTSFHDKTYLIYDSYIS
jgi:hypothetical protein